MFGFTPPGQNINPLQQLMAMGLMGGPQQQGQQQPSVQGPGTPQSFMVSSGAAQGAMPRPPVPQAPPQMPQAGPQSGSVAAGMPAMTQGLAALANTIKPMVAPNPSNPFNAVPPQTQYQNMAGAGAAAGMPTGAAMGGQGQGWAGGMNLQQLQALLAQRQAQQGPMGG